jgi:hypothetical protein
MPTANYRCPASIVPRPVIDHVLLIILWHGFGVGVAYDNSYFLDKRCFNENIASLTDVCRRSMLTNKYSIISRSCFMREIFFEFVALFFSEYFVISDSNLR